MNIEYLRRALRAVSALDPRDPARDRHEVAVSALRAEVVEQIFAERMQSLEWIGDAQGDMTIEEWDAVCAAVRDGDPLKAGQLLISGVRRVIRRDAERHAPQRMEEILREQEYEAAEQKAWSCADA